MSPDPDPGTPAAADEFDEEKLVASNGRKQTGRVTPKGTRPPAKTPRTGSGAAAAGGKGGGAELPVNDGPNRQMRRAGHSVETPDPGPQQNRMRWILIGAGVVIAVSVIACLVLFGLSGTWVGILGLAAGTGTGIAVSTGRTVFADKGRWVAIGLGVIGVLVAGIGLTGVLDIHWPFAALIGCGVGAMFAEVSSQQMTPPDGPPAAAVALLRRMGAQKLDAPTAGGTVWATPDGRIRVIVGATLAKGTTTEKLLSDRNIRRSRQRGDLVLRRMAALKAEKGLVVVVDSAVPTTLDGNDLICSAAGLSKALSR